jgi:hypothetical protein
LTLLLSREHGEWCKDSRALQISRVLQKHKK